MDIAFKARRSAGAVNHRLGGAWTYRRLITVASVLWPALLFAVPGSTTEAPSKGEAAKAAHVAEWRDVPDLVARLKRGGMVLYFRHAATDRNQKDARPADLSDCGKQRNLSEEGRRQSQTIGEAIRALAIPIGPVLSSPFCRTVDTAELAFGKHQKSDALFFAIGVSAADKEKASAALRRMLSQPPAGGNRVVVSHTANLKDATGIWPKPEGVIIVIEPRGAEGFKAVARIEPDDWSRMVAAAKAGQ